MKSRYITAPFILLAFTLLSGCGKSPESTVENFYRSVASGEITEAKGYVSVQLVGMLGEAKLSAALSQETEHIKACGGINTIKVSLTGEGEVRSGTVDVTYKGNCPPKNDKANLIKEDGKWKITASK